MGVSLRTSQRGLSNGRDWGAKTTAVSHEKKEKITQKLDAPDDPTPSHETQGLQARRVV